MNKIRKEFTIIELMIVIGIIGIISSIAIPIYSDYMTRAKVAEALTLLGGLKMPMVDHYDNWGVWPANPGVVGGRESGIYTSIVTSGQAEEDLYYVDALMKGAPMITGKQLRNTYKPSIMDWDCTTEGLSNPIPDKYLPSYCRE
ncbi:MAG: pilin [Thiomargarita sp.]|nr:pilin [Thiomargarita sp.]